MLESFKVRGRVHASKGVAAGSGESVKDALVLRLATADEISHWDENVQEKSPGCGGFLQSVAFSRTKEGFGWRPRYLVYEGKDTTLYALALERNVPTLGRFWYITGLPVTDDCKCEDLLRDIVVANKHASSLTRNVFMIKYEILLKATESRLEFLKSLGLLKTNNLQANTSTVMLDVSGDPEDLLEGIAGRGRRFIRVSQRHGVEAQKLEPTLENQHKMYELMKTINGGKGVAKLRPFDYYHRFWDQFVSENQGSFYGVYEGDRLVSSAFVIAQGKTATYKDGGSTPDRDRSAMQAHAIQWQIIQDLNKMGVQSYDLCGAPPSSRIGDASHPFYGIGVYKTSFNKDVLDRLGTYDQVLNPVVYRAWTKYAGKIIPRIYWATRHNLYW